ncbi:hypothetical protein K456DRAFT_480616 [Colletotrichum gloeosporioides 23]|nr:hypothetical protein K456DRAFT_480616 [Colletotrichum gloeosporioides 23]
MRKSDDGLFTIPGIPRKPQPETHREPSTHNVPHGDSREANDDFRQPQLRCSKLRRGTSPGNTTRLLACPYLKSASGANNHRCKGAAYRTIHRLKEHLYRAHQQQPYCFRCGETFPHQKDVEVHLSRPEGICDLVLGVSVEGLTAEQIETLKSKKRKPGVTTDEEKWQDIFKIVFPDATNRPDPYYCQTDVDSIFSNIPSESGERFFTMLEPVFGPLEKSRRQKVLDTCKCFFAERMHQSR